MFIKIGFDIEYSLPAWTPMILMLYTHPSRSANLRTPERLIIDPNIRVEDFYDTFGNRCARVNAPPGRLQLRTEAIVEDTGVPDAVAPEAQQIPVEQLPYDTLQFLLGSRYCELEKLLGVAWDLFGKTEQGWPRVQAIVDWVHRHIQFGYAHARADKTAFEAYQEGKGVCRDFMHLSIALCRCMNIPARYATGYLGDIGVPAVPLPMDFSAWFEVYLNHQWYTFDARHNRPRIGRILMARGRDAADVALTTTFGKHTLERFHVVTDEVKDPVLGPVVTTNAMLPA